MEQKLTISDTVPSIIAGLINGIMLIMIAMALMQ